MAKRAWRPPLPHAGMNHDAAYDAIADNEAVALYNVITWERGQLRPRYGWTLTPAGGPVPFASTMTAWSTDVPLGHGAVDNEGVIGFTSNASYLSGGGFTADDKFYTRRDRAALSANDTPANTYMLHVNDDAGGVVKNTDAHSRSCVPVGPSVPYESSSYWVGAGHATGFKLAPNWALGTFVDPSLTDTQAIGGRLVRWGGATEVSGSTYAVTLANGSRSGTFGVAPGTSQVGKFLIAGAPGMPANYPFAYTYRIESHTAGATAFTIDKPYGLGATAAQVPNLAAAVMALYTYAPVPMSPVSPSHIALHQDRLFLGQFYSTVTTTTAPNRLSPNAIAWSEAGEPNKWSAERMIAIDDNPDNAITGLVSFSGDVLLIFTQGRTYALVGDGEATYEVRLLSTSYGCVDARGIVSWNGVVMFPSEAGYVMYDGARFTNIMGGANGGGVRSTWDKMAGVGKENPRNFWVVATVTPKGVLIVSTGKRQVATSPMPAHMLVYHIPTAAWSWATGPGDAQLTGSNDFLTRNFRLFPTYPSYPARRYGVMSDGGLYRVDHAYDTAREHANAIGDDGIVTDAYDLNGDTTELINRDEAVDSSSGTVVETTYSPIWVSKVFRPGDGDEVLIEDGFGEHTTYSGTEGDVTVTASSPSITIDLATDHLIPVAARASMVPGAGAAESTTMQLYLPSHHGAGDGTSAFSFIRYFRDRMHRNVANTQSNINLPAHAIQFKVTMPLPHTPRKVVPQRIYGLRFTIADTGKQGYTK